MTDTSTDTIEIACDLSTEQTPDGQLVFQTSLLTDVTAELGRHRRHWERRYDDQRFADEEYLPSDLDDRIRHLFDSLFAYKGIDRLRVSMIKLIPIEDGAQIIVGLAVDGVHIDVTQCLTMDDPTANPVLHPAWTMVTFDITQIVEHVLGLQPVKELVVIGS